jgi:hypothetical protein
MGHVKRWLQAVLRFGRSRLARNIGIGVVAAFVVFTLLGFFAVPYLVSRYITTDLAASLRRKITVGPVHFNPYSLDLNLRNLTVGERGQPQTFLRVEHLHVDASWWSLFRLAPIISALDIDQPQMHVVRIANGQFNFSDLLQSSPQKPKSGPTRFSISNLRLRNGLINFNDRVLNQQHKISDLQIGVPFIANLPSDVNVYVQPLLEMVIDGGTPLRITGRALPFSSPPESVLNINLERLQLPRYVAYLPSQIPIKLPQGTLSCRMLVHFVSSPAAPVMRLAGTIAFDDLDVRDRTSKPLFTLKHAQAVMTDVEPMRKFAALDSIQIVGLNADLTLNRDGTTNLTSLTAGNSSQPAKAPAASAQSTSTNLILKSFDLSQSSLNVTDNRGPAPAKLTLGAIHFALQNLATQSQTPATFNASAQLGSGTVAADGTINVPKSQMASNITLAQIALPPLQPLVHAPAKLAAGELNLHAKAQANYGSNFNLHVEPASISLDDVRLAAPAGSEAPIEWKSLKAAIDRFDLASHEASIGAVTFDQMHLLVRREHDGTINLLSMMGVSPAPAPAAQANASAAATPNGTASRAPAGPVIRNEQVMVSQTAQAVKHAVPKTPAQPPSASAAKPAPAAEQWKYQIASFTAHNASVHVIDQAAPQPVDLTVAPFNFQLNGMSNDLSKPIKMEADGTIKRGTFKLAGTVAPQPLQANLHINTNRLDLAALDPYLTSEYNASITQAELTMNAQTELAQANNRLRGRYTGDATLANFRVVDKVTSQPFARWSTFSAKHIDASYGERTRVKVGQLALNDFQAGIILNADGHLNLRDIQAGAKGPGTSLRRTQKTGQPTPMQRAAARETAAKPEIAIGGFVMRHGLISYTDNFIKPNYHVRLTGVGGRVGAFGTNSQRPAPVSLQGKVNNSAPINIKGSVNPLAPMAFVDLNAKAEGIELPKLSTYSAKYTGYPIIKGTLTMDVHYLLEHQKLTAQNHIFINQLTFGPKVVSPNAINLPIRLAVALLKDPQGRINLDVPVSGSLSDPHFSLGSVILSALKNIIIKAASAPFKLIASAFGGGKHEQLDHIDFTPGFAKLTADSRSKLNTLAKALTNKPSLGLSISGHVDPAVDVEGLKHAKLDREVKAEKIKELEKKGEQVNPAQVEVSKSEYKKYLTRVYKAAKFPKPRNFIGLEKSLPEDQMIKLMVEHISVNDHDLQHLAERRADVVRAYLSQQEVDPSRLFIETPKLTAENEKAPRVDLSIQ